VTVSLRVHLLRKCYEGSGPGGGGWEGGGGYGTGDGLHRSHMLRYCLIPGTGNVKGA